jgi:predicted PurR-regulated permease PerM
MGSALHLHLLAVLVMTIGARCIFGMLGLVLAALLTSAAVHITRARARAAAPPPREPGGGAATSEPREATAPA